MCLRANDEKTFRYEFKGREEFPSSFPGRIVVLPGIDGGLFTCNCHIIPGLLEATMFLYKYLYHLVAIFN